jgi:hypothetical protein
MFVKHVPADANPSKPGRSFTTASLVVAKTLGEPEPPSNIAIAGKEERIAFPP